MRLKRIIMMFIMVPIALALIVFIIANREMMSVRFNPFDHEDQSWTIRAPAFIFLFACLGMGVVVGSVATWVGQHHYRRKARRIDEALDRSS